MKKSLRMKIMLLLITLTVGGLNMWAQRTAPDLSAMIWSTPIVDENFNSATAAMATATHNPGITNYTAMGEFNCVYNNSTDNQYGIENNTTLSSKALKLYAGSGKPLIAAISGPSYSTTGAYSFKITKASNACLGLYNEEISGTALGHAKATAFLQNNAGTLKMSNGSSWITVGSFTSTDVLEICVIYNSTNSNTTYGDGVSLVSKTAHIYVNGACVMNGDNPKAFTIPGVAAVGFRAYPAASSGNVAIIDDIKIYDALPTAPAYTITPAVNDADMGSAELTGAGTITATPNDGYRVISGTGGYTVSSGTATVTNNGDNTFSVVPSSNCTITINFEAIPTRTITLGSHDGGTVTIENAGVAVASGSSVREGTLLTITAAAGVGKVFNSWSVTGATPASTTDLTTTFTVGVSNVTIAATFDDATTYPIHWSVNGTVIKTDNIVEDEDISFDAPASGIPAGYTFKGWVVAANLIDGSQSSFDSKKYVTSAKSTAEITYYAVMAVDVSGATDELNRALTGVDNGSTTYTAWSGKTASSDAVYAGKSAGDKNSIQLRTKNSEEGVITTASGGNVKKVTIDWQSDTGNGRTLNIYGKNTAYSVASDLFNDNKGTLLGTIVKGTSTVLNISGDYTFIGFRSADGAMYLSKVTIDWGTSTNFCTTINNFETAGNWNTAGNWSWGAAPSATEPAVTISAECTIPNGVTANVNNIIIASGGSLIINDGGQLICNSSVSATVKKTIADPAKTDYGHWYTISTPVHKGATDNVVISETNLTSVGSENYDMFAYDEENGKWLNQKKTYNNEEPPVQISAGFSNMTVGRGYLYRNNGTDLVITGNTNTGDAITYTLTKTGDGAISGFNLLGNPYPHDITLKHITYSKGDNLTGCYVLSNAGAWGSELAENATISSYQGFLVQADVDDKVATFHETAQRGAKSNGDNIKFMVANSQYEDVAYALFDKGFGLSKINHRNADIPMLYINQEDADYAIATMSDDTKSFNLNFKAMTTGKYTLSYKADGNFSYLHVIDRLTGEDVDMLLEGEYSFIASPSDSENRFIVRLEYSAGSEISESSIFAYQSGNDIIVNGEGELQIFDMMGRRVLTQYVSGVETINLQSHGVYIFKLNEKTQKIVVR